MAVADSLSSASAVNSPALITIFFMLLALLEAERRA
jgi:hypothetical protein